MATTSSSIGGSIASLLGTSGIDTSSLVSQLVSAARSPRATVINDRATLNSTRISALASARSSLDTFAKALEDTLSGASFSGQPVSNDPTIVAVSLKTGGVPTGLPAQIEVIQLASAQTLESISLTDANTAVGLGTLTLTTPSGAKTITIDGSNNSLTGLAAAINASGAGVTASIVTDNRGARLVMKGASGDANAYTLTKGPTDTADADLARFTFDGVTGGMTRSQEALDSIVKIDGVEMQNDDNVLENAIPYVRIDLNKAAPGTLVTLATDEPTSSIKDLVKEFVSAYNTLRSALNDATAVGKDASSSGALAGDSSVRDMLRQLTRLSTTQLASTGDYRSLSDIGVSTNQDGTLKVDETRLTAALAKDPTAITQMINPTVSSASNPGLAASVKAIQTSLEGDNGALTSAKTKYDKLAAEYTKQLATLDSQMTNYEEQLTRTYAAMQTRLNAFKATQTYLTQQIDAWNNSNND